MDEKISKPLVGFKRSLNEIREKDLGPCQVLFNGYEVGDIALIYIRNKANKTKKASLRKKIFLTT